MKILTLGNKIKSRRKELGLTLKELAGDRVTPAQLSYVETDKCKPSLDLLEYISQRLDLEMDYLLESERQQVSRFCELKIKIAKMDILNGNIEDAKSSLSKVECTAQSYELLDYLGQAQHVLGQINHDCGNYDIAWEYYLNALHKFSKMNDEVKVAEVYLDLGVNDYTRGHFDSSLGYLKLGEQFINCAGDVEVQLKFKIEYYLMAVYTKIEDCNSALHYAERVSKSLDLIRDRKRYCEGMTLKVKDLERQNNVSLALKLAELAISASENANNMQFVGTALTHVGSIYSTNHKVEESLFQLNKALEIKRVTDDSTLPLTYIQYARGLALKKDYEGACEILSEALNISIRTGDRKYESQTYLALFEVFMEKGDLIKAEESLRRCGDILEAIGTDEKLAQYHIKMSEFYRSINREKQAVNCILKAIDIYKNIGKVSNELTLY